MKALSIALKDFEIFVKDRGSLIYLFLLPIGFIMLFAGLGANAGSTEDDRLPLTVANSDPNGKAAQTFVQNLLKSDKLAVTLKEPAEVETLLDQSDLRWALYIPANFSAEIEADHQATVRLVAHPYHNQVDLKTIERALQSAIRNMGMMNYLDNTLEQLRDMQANDPEAANYLTQKRIDQQVEEQKVSAQERPLVNIEEVKPGGTEEAEKQEVPAMGQATVVGFATLFVFLSAQTTAQSIFNEKRQGSFRRLLAAPLSKAALLTGKLLLNLALTLAQIVVILLTGLFLIPIFGLPPLDLSADPLGLALASLAIALCSTSLGILIAAIAHSEGQVGSLSSGLLWVAGFLGGSMIPSFLFPDFLQTISKVLPHYWANQAYFGLILRSQTLAQVWPDVLILLGFTLVFFIIGLWRFDFD